MMAIMPWWWDAEPTVRMAVLPNPVKDAREVAAMLKGLGWHVETLENPDSRIFRRSLNRLITGPGKKKGNRHIVLVFRPRPYLGRGG